MSRFFPCNNAHNVMLKYQKIKGTRTSHSPGGGPILTITQISIYLPTFLPLSIPDIILSARAGKSEKHKFAIRLQMRLAEFGFKGCHY